MRGISAPPASESERFGPYQLGKLLGKGGMGEVFEADDLETGRRVALKILGRRLDSPAARRRFLNEGRLAATINHPNSVYVFGAEEIAGVPVITMELMPGGTLLEKVCSQGPLPFAEAADIALQVIDGLSAAHAAGILHRDIKPSNCFVDDDGSVKIGDYGLSISTKGHERPPVGEESFMGTPMYAAPEQLRGDDLTVRSDIYSLGATLFTVLAGEPPFLSKDTIRLLAKVLESPAPDLRELRPDIPKGLAQAVNRCLAKRPDDRFAGCADLRAAIAPFSSRGKTAAQPWQRLVAGALDMAVVGVPFLIASRLIPATGYLALAVDAALLLGALASWIAWFTLFEWKRGATPGKALLGLEVRPLRADANPWTAGLRILGRAACFVLLPLQMAVLVFPSVFFAETDSHLIRLPALTMWTCLVFVLFAGARRKNGWLAFHDWLSDTRVVAPFRREISRHRQGQNESLPVAGAPMLGPFHILEAVPGCDDWQIGYDSRLLRKTWLRKLPPGTPPVAAAQRNLRRPGRLRWLAGMRSAEENWDAYEFPGGRPLARGRVAWRELRPWLADLAAELTAANTDGTTPAAPALEQVWIAADGRAKLLDFPAPGLQPTAPSSTRPLWIDLTERLLDHRPLPLPVRAFLKNLPALHDPAAIGAELEHLAAVPDEVSRARRLGIIAASAAGPLLLGLILFFLRDSSLTAALSWSLAALIACVALPAIVTAAWAGDGLILRTMGVCVVDRDGNPAVGSRASRRSLFAWLPVLASPVIFAALMVWTEPFAAAFSTVAALALLAVVSALLPGKSLHDRLAGTCLVPR
jgi:eukaryotic-like serine/threonine-protein kinase